MGKLDGKIAIVTGAASGIGAATAEVFAGYGAEVVVADINGEGAEAVAERIRKAGGAAIAHLVDVSNEQAVEAMVRAAVEKFGGLDILVSNAAELSPDVVGRDLGVTNTTNEVIEKTFGVNYWGVVFGMRHAIPQMRDGGSLITILSTEIDGPEGGTRTAYGASKSAAKFHAEQAAVGLGGQKIRSNCIAPSLIETPPVMNLLPRQMRDVIVAEQLVPRMGQPADVAETAAFLASDHAGFITGQTIRVDGGSGSHSPARTGINKVIAEMMTATPPSQT